MDHPLPEMYIIAGKHKCGRRMDMRITPVKEDDSKPDSVFSHIIYGVCKKCKVVLASAIIMKKEEPIRDVDYTIEWNTVATESNKSVDDVFDLKKKG